MEQALSLSDHARGVDLRIIGAARVRAIERFRGWPDGLRRPALEICRRSAYMRPRGAGWRVRTTFLGAVRSPWGLSLSRLVGFGIWLPPTYVGARDHRPTAVSAPRSILHGFPIGD